MDPLSVPDQIPETRTQKKNLGMALRLNYTPNSYTPLYKLRQRQGQRQHCWQPPGLAKHDMQCNIYLIYTQAIQGKRGGERGRRAREQDQTRRRQRRRRGQEQRPGPPTPEQRTVEVGFAVEFCKCEKGEGGDFKTEVMEVEVEFAVEICRSDMGEGGD